MKHIPQIDLARLAAYIDGEGAILLNRHVSKRRAGLRNMWVRLIVANTDPRLPQWILNVTGVGKVELSDRRRKETHRQSFRWQANCRQATEIISACLPYFVIKREEAEIALAFQATIKGPGSIISEELLRYRESLREQLHARKRAGTAYNSTPGEILPQLKRGPKPKGSDQPFLISPYSNC